MSFSTMRGLARRTEIKYAVLLAVMARIESNYRLVRIPKATPGEFRQLSVPKPTLRAIQRVILDEALVYCGASQSAHAYVRDRSIITNAQVHVGARSFIKIDIKDFFPSVGVDRVERVFLALGYGTEVARLLTRLCTFEGGLPQGAPTSPALSNAVLTELDASLQTFADTHGLKYTRYADDLILSGKAISLDLYPLATDLVELHGFRVNPLKTRLMTKPSKIVLAGISISSGGLKVPRKFKRDARQASHKLLRDGLAAFQTADGFDPFAVDRAIGRLLFWQRVEPQATFPPRHIELLKAKFLGSARKAGLPTPAA